MTDKFIFHGCDWRSGFSNQEHENVVLFLGEEYRVTAPERLDKA